RSASKGEGRSRLDFPLIHDVGSSYQPQNNTNNIKGLAFYHEIRWSLEFSSTFGLARGWRCPRPAAGVASAGAGMTWGRHTSRKTTPTISRAWHFTTKSGGVWEICCALHNFRVRLTPWQPMV